MWHSGHWQTTWKKRDIPCRGWPLRMGIVLVGWAATPIRAQITYSVFPATPVGSIASIPQPTDRGTASRVTLRVQDSTVAFVIRSLAHQAHLRLQFDEAYPQFAKRVTLAVVDRQVMDALALALQGTGLTARLASDGETVLVRPLTGSSASRVAQASGSVTGRVTDSASGAGLGGAAVRIAGTKLSAVTSDSGNFTVRNVPAGDQLLAVRLFGYKPVDRAVTVVDSQRTIVRIVMVSVPTVLSGVVTTAAGNQRKVEIGNDITSINVDSVMKVAPVSTVTDLLETRVPGLTVLHSSGAPGDPSRLRLRGASSILGNNDPIFIVDGIRVYAAQSDARNDNLATSLIGRNNTGNVRTTGLPLVGTSRGYASPSPIDQIDPSSIESIEVLKGPSASALYGSDAANGVIVITTKHGRSGPTHWSSTIGFGRNTEPGSWPVNYYRFGTGASTESGSFFCQWNDQTCVTDSVVGFQALNDPRYSVFADHGSDETYTASVSGGLPTLQYSFSGSGAGDIGLIKLPGIEQTRYEKFYNEPVPSWMKRPQNYTTWGVDGQVSAQPTATVRATVSSSLFNSNQQNSSLEAAIDQLQGTYIDPTQLTAYPLVTQFVERALARQTTVTNTANVSWQATPWLPITVTGGINTMQRTDQTYIPYGVNSSANGDGSCDLDACILDTTGSYGLGRGTSQMNTLSIGTAIPTLRNHLTVALGSNLTTQSTADFTAYTSLLTPGVSMPTTFPTTPVAVEGYAPTSPSTFSQLTTDASTYGVYLQTQIRLPGNLYLNPGFRLDGGSATGANASSGISGLSGLTGFPKIDLSYLLIDQDHPRGIISLLRPRLAYGRAGTQPGPAQKLRLFSDTLVTVNGDTTLVPNVAVTTLGNTQLRPETTDELEGGFDLDLWQNRLQVTWTQYNNTRHNAIISFPIAPSVNGGGSIAANIGEVRNTGHELTLTAQVFQSRALGWTIGGNISNDNNVVVHLNNGQSVLDLGNGTRVVVGYPLDGRWALPIVSYADQNGDGIISGNEIKYGDSVAYVGQPNPKYQMNLNTGITLFNGRLSVNATFAYQAGLTQFNDGALSSGAFALLGNTPGISLATQAAITAATGGGICTGSPLNVYYNHCPAVSDIGAIQTVNTLRFNDLSINYAVPRSLAQRFHAPTMSISLQGSNLALHSNYRGKDPSVNAFSTVSSGDETIDLGQLPQPRTWWLKLSLGN